MPRNNSQMCPHHSAKYISSVHYTVQTHPSAQIPITCFLVSKHQHSTFTCSTVRAAQVCILRSRTMGSAISDTAEFPPTSHAHIHRPGLAFSCVSLPYNNLCMCFSRNTAKNKSKVICVMCGELVVGFSDRTIF